MNCILTNLALPLRQDLPSYTAVDFSPLIKLVVANSGSTGEGDMYQILGGLGLILASATVYAQAAPERCPPSSCPEASLEILKDEVSLGALIRRAFYSEDFGDVIYVMERKGKYSLFSFANGNLGYILDLDEKIIPPSLGGPTKLSEFGWSLSFTGGSLEFYGGRPVPSGGQAIRAMVLETSADRREYRPLSNEEIEIIRGRLTSANQNPISEWRHLSELAGKSWVEYGHPQQRLHRFDWDIVGWRLIEREVVIDEYGNSGKVHYRSNWYDPIKDQVSFDRYYDPEAGRYVFGSFLDGSSFNGPFKPIPASKGDAAQLSWVLVSYRQIGVSQTILKRNSRQSTHGLKSYGLLKSSTFEQAVDELKRFNLERLAEQRSRENRGSGIMNAVSGVIMGAATGYADSGGDTAGAIAGAMGGAAVGSAGGNDAHYQYLEQRRAEVTADAEASERQLQRTIAQAERQGREQAQSSAQGSAGPSFGDRVVAQEQARAEQTREERATRVFEERRIAEAEAAATRAREEQARRDAEVARTRPVEWMEGVVLCEPRANSKQWRCVGPLQTNVLELDASSTFTQLALACGGDSGIREIGPAGRYRAYGCGFGIHPTASNYPGNRDVPKDFGVFVSDRRLFHCPPTKDAYCRTP